MIGMTPYTCVVVQGSNGDRTFSGQCALKPFLRLRVMYLEIHWDSSLTLRLITLCLHLRVSVRLLHVCVYICMSDCIVPIQNSAALAPLCNPPASIANPRVSSWQYSEYAQNYLIGAGDSGISFGFNVSQRVNVLMVLLSATMRRCSVYTFG